MAVFYSIRYVFLYSENAMAHFLVCTKQKLYFAGKVVITQ